MSERIQGLVAATFTPMHEDGAIHPELAAPLVEQLLADGVAGIFVNGSSGEGVCLTSEERRRMAEAYVQAVAGRMAVIVHAGHNSLREAASLAAHAAGHGRGCRAAQLLQTRQRECTGGLLWRNCRRSAEAALLLLSYSLPQWGGPAHGRLPQAGRARDSQSRGSQVHP